MAGRDDVREGGGMTLYEELAKAVEEKLEEGELPVWLADEVLEVSANPGKYEAEAWLVEILLMQVREFTVYAETGCCKFAYDHEDVKRTLRQLGERVGAR
jgi:hypothetical protein